MRLEFYMSPNQHRRFASSMEILMRNVDRGTRRATEQACREVLESSLEQVPRDTGTLASTAFYTVRRRTDISGYRYEGIVGYAGMAGLGSAHDSINPKSKAAASAYAFKVHEDLNATHPNGGKAKFLEDPVRAYAAENFRRVAETHWQFAVDGSSMQL